MAHASLTPVTLPADPTNALEAATKQYADLHGVPSGGSTGYLLRKASATDYDDAWTDPATIPVSGFGAATTTLNMGGFNIVSLGAAAGGLHALNRNSGDVRYPQLATVTAKGDLYAATASGAIARQGVGANGTGLIADSSQTTGVAWGPSPLVFASVAAHDAAITSPTAGMTCITTDTGTHWQYFTTQGWYRPNCVLYRAVQTTLVPNFTTAGVDVCTSGSIAIPAGRRLEAVAHYYITTINGGIYYALKIDGTAQSYRIAQSNTIPANMSTIQGQMTFTPSAGNHTFGCAAYAITQNCNIEGQIEPGFFEIRDIGAA